MEYLTLKWLHVLSSTVLFGAGVASAFYLVLATLTRDAKQVAVVSRLVVVTDWVFTAATAVFQPLSGFWMLHVAGIPFSTPWVRWSTGLYAFAIACWLPVVWIQLRLRDLSQAAARDGTDLPPRYWRLFGVWTVLGFAAFFAFLAIFHLMITKQLPGGT